MFIRAIPEPVFLETSQKKLNKQLFFAFTVGMVINLLSIYIGNPYTISLMVLAVAAIMTIKWMSYPAPWIVLVSVLAANPVNINAPISMNLLFAIVLLILNMNFFNKVPSWLYLVLVLACISIIGSINSWSITDGYFTQFAAVGNYVIGPFLLLPLIYCRLQREVDAALLLRIFVLSLILPSVIFLLMARLFGTAMVDVNSTGFGYLVNVSIYHLGNVDFQLTRTQVGIPLAALICASFTVVIGDIVTRFRLIALATLLSSIFLLLVTGSVGSSLAVLCGMAMILLLSRRYVSIKKYLTVIPFLMVFVMIGWRLIPSGLKSYVESRYEQKLSGGVNTSDRSGLWEVSLNYLVDNPLGRGWDLYVEPIRIYPHNDYLSYGIAFGFVCGLLYLFVPAKILSTMIVKNEGIRDPAQVAILLAGVGVVVVLLFNSFTDHLTANRWYFNVVWSMIWYCYFAKNATTSQIIDNEKLKRAI